MQKYVMLYITLRKFVIKNCKLLLSAIYIDEGECYNNDYDDRCT